MIAKLAEGNAAHVPFRDSKLTRVLSSSLTGSGARIAVVCTVTPGSAQAEETHNTLKFATRAKKARLPRDSCSGGKGAFIMAVTNRPCLAHGLVLLQECPMLRGSGVPTAVYICLRSACARCMASRNGHPHAQVAVRAERNEVLDQQSLIVRYQQQMAALRAHLRRVSSASAACSVHDPMHPEVCDLLHTGRNVQQPNPEAAKHFWPNSRVA